MRLPRSRTFYAALVLVAVAIVTLANAHLVIVAGSSQPRCIEHIRPGEAGTGAIRFGAAGSAC
ncbi:MAG: hypothetical protein KGL48_17090 [Sphingomonadales bacterium]|nr:hypothetical protein [Sphingomonadales bacterium]MDE2567717.1 hypothetical protein [Sphingomonadales bacterium]